MIKNIVRGTVALCALSALSASMAQTHTVKKLLPIESSESGLGIKPLTNPQKFASENESLAVNIREITQPSELNSGGAALPISPVWTLTAGHTIGQDLKTWAKAAQWSVIWNLTKDWAVPASTSFTGDFADAASAVIKTLAANGALVRAEIYDGNKTIVISGPGAAQQ